VVTGDGAQIPAAEFVEARAAEAEFIGGRDAGDFVAAESGAHFANQGRTEAMGELTIMFFIAARMARRRGLGAGRAPAGRGVFAFARNAADCPICAPPSHFQRLLTDEFTEGLLAW
jgi:hypothetical protein